MPPRGRLRFKDLGTPATLITLSRFPIAVMFPFLAHKPSWALTAYLFALFTDVLDGVVARKTGKITHTGAVLDGWIDKILHINAAWALVVYDHMPGWWMAFWFSRELVQAPMVFWLTGRFRRGEVRTYDASLLGKTCAISLAFAMSFTIVGWTDLAAVLTPIVGISGFGSAMQYIIQERRDRTHFKTHCPPMDAPDAVDLQPRSASSRLTTTSAETSPAA